MALLVPNRYPPTRASINFWEERFGNGKKGFIEFMREKEGAGLEVDWDGDWDGEY